MDVPFWIGDREFREADLELIRNTVQRFSRLSREEIAATLCENLPWKSPNGRLKVEACHKLLLKLEQKGVITLPPLRAQGPRGCRERRGGVVQTQLQACLRDVLPVIVEPVRPEERADWNATMATYHPLGYLRGIGARIQYWIRAQGPNGPVIVGAMLFGAAAKALAARDQWIGWTAEQRRRYRPRIVNNNRFLILPGVQIPHLASHALALAARRIRADWKARYGFEPVLLETFIEPQYPGTCYRAANWIEIGKTAGRKTGSILRVWNVREIDLGLSAGAGLAEAVGRTLSTACGRRVGGIEMTLRNPESIHPWTLPNRKSSYRNSEEERADRQTAVEAQLPVWRALLPGLMEKFSRIADPRRPGSIRHKLTVLLTFGLFMFIFQYASRRRANRELTRPTFWEHFREIFPEVETIPHMDTVQRILERINPGELEEVMTATVKRLLRSGRLKALLVEKQYVIAIDGTQKASRGQPWASEALHRRHGENEVSSMAYALEASLVSPQGVVLPFLTEFCENAAEQQEFEKQDSELKACKRLLTRLRKMFPKLRILVVADGLYPNGPMMALCRDLHLDFMFVLPQSCLPSVWEEVKGLRKIEPNERRHRWGNREQIFWWINQIDYDFREAFWAHRGEAAGGALGVGVRAAADGTKCGEPLQSCGTPPMGH
ncbi:Druantia anti-phage system protein DruA [Kyrpidia spormannii]|uniref:H repeat-associated protein N-terminal domain-containing protein n=1 Tax=Kyrpidia spormannii TaxID=2055160 RepID=A0A6F9ECR2_9BACL|nr:Druantia anti-phage system protein DruA [Kyrpidia spormannii]CAB3394665.1 protein of unknown function [Kyrpidia spormannii]